MDRYAQQIWDGIEGISLDKAIECWSGKLPLLLELADTPQEPIWHAEGDVAIHTQMVIDEMLLLLDANDSLTTRQRFVLQMSALLHDIAKPLVTTKREVRGAERIVAPRHAQRGAAWLAYRLPELEIPLDVVHEILALVYYHHDPKFLIIKDRDTGAFRRLGRQASSLGLYLLEMADMRGRRCEDRDANIEMIEMYRMFCEDAGVWDNWSAHAPFVRHICETLNGQEETLNTITERAIREGIWDWESSVIYTPEEAVSRAYGSQSRFLHVVLTCGPSGSGKSTWLHEQYPDYEYVAMDEIRQRLTKSAEDQSQNAKVFSLAREQFKEALRAQRDVVWDATSMRREQREAVLETARDYGAHTTLAVFQPSITQYTQRNRARTRLVPEPVITRQINGLQWPEADEAHRVIWIDGQGQVCRDTRQWVMQFVE